jgi:hypothetical protein
MYAGGGFFLFVSSTSSLQLFLFQLSVVSDIAFSRGDLSKQVPGRIKKIK